MRHLRKVGNSMGLILMKDEIAELGIHDDEEVIVEKQDGIITIESARKRMSPLESFRASIKGLDPNIADAIIDASVRQSRRQQMNKIKSERSRASR